MSGEANIFAVYKPKGPTSHDIAEQIKTKFPGEKVGHAGTLDPLASGVLVIGVGRQATKKLHSPEFSEKEYRATIKLGENSTTDDEEGQKTKVVVGEIPDEEKVRQVLKEFVGSIEQVPPIYSAIKLQGTPSYKFARQGKKPEISGRTVVIKEIELLNYNWPKLTIRVMTGPGVYIRSLARDVGQKLGTGGYISALERTRVGDFTIDKAIPIETIAGQ